MCYPSGMPNAKIIQIETLPPANPGDFPSVLALTADGRIFQMFPEIRRGVDTAQRGGGPGQAHEIPTQSFTHTP
jgi:hypothetical protein